MQPARTSRRGDSQANPLSLLDDDNSDSDLQERVRSPLEAGPDVRYELRAKRVPVDRSAEQKEALRLAGFAAQRRQRGERGLGPASRDEDRDDGAGASARHSRHIAATNVSAALRSHLGNGRKLQVFPTRTWIGNTESVAAAIAFIPAGFVSCVQLREGSGVLTLQFPLEHDPLAALRTELHHWNLGGERCVFALKIFPVLPEIGDYYDPTCQTQPSKHWLTFVVNVKDYQDILRAIDHEEFGGWGSVQQDASAELQETFQSRIESRTTPRARKRPEYVIEQAPQPVQHRPKRRRVSPPVCISPTTQAKPAPPPPMPPRPPRRRLAQPFAYPPGDQNAVTVTDDELARTEPQEMLNDSVIDFYLRWLQSKLERDKPNVASCVHFFSSFFLKKLAGSDGINGGPVGTRGGVAAAQWAASAFQRVKRWTERVSIFDKDFLFVPVHQGLHWSVLVIGYPGAGSLPDTVDLVDDDGDGERGSADGTKVPRCPFIVHFDSMRGSHTGFENLLRQYLAHEWSARHKCDGLAASEKRFSTDVMRFERPKVPQQDNTWDCGLFMLQFIESFIEEAEKLHNTLGAVGLRGKDGWPYCFTLNWFHDQPTGLLKREYVKRLILNKGDEDGDGGPLSGVWDAVAEQLAAQHNGECVVELGEPSSAAAGRCSSAADEPETRHVESPSPIMLVSEAEPKAAHAHCGVFVCTDGTKRIALPDASHEPSRLNLVEPESTDGTPSRKSPVPTRAPTVPTRAPTPYPYGAGANGENLSSEEEEDGHAVVNACDDEEDFEPTGQRHASGKVAPPETKKHPPGSVINLVDE